MSDRVHPALIGQAGERMVAAELMRRGVEVARPYSDVGVDLIAYRLDTGSTSPTKIVPIQIKSASAVAFNFHKKWLLKAPNLVLAWELSTTPEFYVFDSISRIEEALGPQFITSASWTDAGVYTVTKPNAAALKRMEPHRDQWDRILSQL